MILVDFEQGGNGLQGVPYQKHMHIILGNNFIQGSQVHVPPVSVGHVLDENFTMTCNTVK